MKENELLLKLVKINKLIIVLLIAILILLTMGVSKMYTNEDTSITSESSNQEGEYNTDYDVSSFTEIKAKDIKSKTKSKLQVVYIGRETCGWCAAFLPNLWDAQKEFDY